MFTRHGKNKKPESSRSLNDLIAMKTVEELFFDDKRRKILAHIKKNTHLAPSRFDSLCLTLIHNIAKHCQSLPESSNSYYINQGGLLDHLLHRTEAALELFQQYIVADEEALSDEQKLWLYTLFSASMLQGLGKLGLDYAVELYDSGGNPLKTWNPLLEGMGDFGSYYDYKFQHSRFDDSRRLITLLLARLLMPQQGFAWIASDPEVLSVWLALLNEDWQSAGTLAALLMRADALSIQEYFDELLEKLRISRSGRLSRISTFVDNSPESLYEKEKMIGLEFLDWLRQSLDSGKIIINRPPLFMVPGGFVMSTEAFKWFSREHPEYKNAQAVQHAFLALGLHGAEHRENVVTRFEQPGNHLVENGIQFAQYAVTLPPTARVLWGSNIVKLPASEIINISTFSDLSVQRVVLPSASLLRLNMEGTWEVPEGSALSLQSGSRNRG